MRIKRWVKNLTIDEWKRIRMKQRIEYNTAWDYERDDPKFFEAMRVDAILKSRAGNKEAQRFLSAIGVEW